MKSATQLAIQIALGVNYLSGLQPLCTPPKPTLCQIPPCVRQAWRPTLAKQLRDFFGGRFVLATIKVEMAFAARQSSLPLRPSASTWVGRWARLRRNTPKKSPSAMRAQAFFLAETVRFELTDGYPSAVFKTAGLNHSPKSPGRTAAYSSPLGAALWTSIGASGCARARR